MKKYQRIPIFRYPFLFGNILLKKGDNHRKGVILVNVTRYVNGNKIKSEQLRSIVIGKTLSESIERSVRGVRLKIRRSRAVGENKGQ